MNGRAIYRCNYKVDMIKSFSLSPALKCHAHLLMTRRESALRFLRLVSLPNIVIRSFHTQIASRALHSSTIIITPRTNQAVAITVNTQDSLIALELPAVYGCVGLDPFALG